MSNTPKIWEYPTLSKLVTRLRDDLNNANYVLLFAYNGTGKTRLSMEFKNAGKRDVSSDTLYFNAYTEDLFSWDNDLESDTERYLRLNTASKFFSGFKELALEGKIFSYLERYADFDFKIDYEQWSISFSRGEEENIKISRGEENIFIWCIFLAICTLVIEGHESYAWVKYIYIDDPISSLDDNNAIAVATDLINTLKNQRIQQSVSFPPIMDCFSMCCGTNSNAHIQTITLISFTARQKAKSTPCKERTKRPSFIMWPCSANCNRLWKAIKSTRIISMPCAALWKKQPFSLATKIFHRAFMALMTKCCIHAPSIS